MAKLSSMPQEAIVSGYKGVVDFYYWMGIPVARSWPRKPLYTRSAAEMATHMPFVQAVALWPLLSPEVQRAYQKMSTDSALTNRDVFTKSYISGLYRNPHTPT